MNTDSAKKIESWSDHILILMLDYGVWMAFFMIIMVLNTLLLSAKLIFPSPTLSNEALIIYIYWVEIFFILSAIAILIHFYFWGSGKDFKKTKNHRALIIIPLIFVQTILFVLASFIILYITVIAAVFYIVIKLLAGIYFRIRPRKEKGFMWQEPFGEWLRTH